MPGGIDEQAKEDSVDNLYSRGAGGISLRYLARG